MEDRLQSLIRDIPPLDARAMQLARERLGRLTKPPGSLGRLEDLAVQLAGIMGDSRPRSGRKVIFVFAGDHGVVREGVSAYPQVVTAQMVANFLRGGAAINVLARRAGADIVVADFGIAARELLPQQGFVDCSLRRGTGNILCEDAMTREEAIGAFLAGYDLAAAEIARGARMVGLGEMGIGNTTASSAMVAAFLNCPPAEVVGPGTGLDADGVRRKAAVVERALRARSPDVDDPVDVAAKVGGLEIAGLAGVAIAAASRRVPVLVDGFITGAAALLAARLAPGVVPYLIASHCSAEPGHRVVLQALGLQPLIDLGLRLGEGTGAALAMPIVEASLALLNEMATFEEAGVTDRG